MTVKAHKQPSWLQRVGVRALKSLGVEFPGLGTGGYGWGGPSWSQGYYPDSGYDFSVEAGELYRNSAVMACIAWMQRTYPEARLQVTVPSDDGDREAVEAHPLVKLLERPNAFYSGDLLWQATLLDFVPLGNAYWLKARGGNGAGGVKELYHVPARLMAPYRNRGSQNFIDGYRYSPNGVPQVIPREDVIHFRYGMDPSDPMRGLSPLVTAQREVAADNEMTTYTATIMRNLGVVGGIITNEDKDFDVTPQTATDLRTQFQAMFTGDGRGRIMVPNFPAKYAPVGNTPEDMALNTIRNVPEDRICAVLGLSSMVVGLTAGALSKTYANYAEAREAAIEGNMLPTLKLFAQELTLQLLPDFDATEGARVEHDTSDIRALQPDEDKLHERARSDYAAGVITLNQALNMMGLPDVPDGDTRKADPLPPEDPGYNGGMDETGAKPSDERLTVVSTGKALSGVKANGNGRHPAKQAWAEWAREDRLRSEREGLTHEGEWLEEDREGE